MPGSASVEAGEERKTNGQKQYHRRKLIDRKKEAIRRDRRNE